MKNKKANLPTASSVITRRNSMLKQWKLRAVCVHLNDSSRNIG